MICGSQCSMISRLYVRCAGMPLEITAVGANIQGAGAAWSGPYESLQFVQNRIYVKHVLTHAEYDKICKRYLKGELS